MSYITSLVQDKKKVLNQNQKKDIKEKMTKLNHDNQTLLKTKTIASVRKKKKKRGLKV